MTMRLSEEALLTALHAWPLPSPRLVQRLPAGFTSEVWLVEAGGAHFVAKYADQSQEALEAGLFAAELAERHGISSGAPLRTKEGALSLLVAEPSGQRRPLALLRFVEGSPLDVAEPGAALLYGQMLGRTHTLLQRLVQQVPLDLYDFLLQEEDYVMSQPGLAEFSSYRQDGSPPPRGTAPLRVPPAPADHLAFRALLDLIGRQVQTCLDLWMIEHRVFFAASHKSEPGQIGEHRSSAVLAVESEQNALL